MSRRRSGLRRCAVFAGNQAPRATTSTKNSRMKIARVKFERARHEFLKDVDVAERREEGDDDDCDGEP